ncbi:hypothetical protein GF336_01450 [Candidatus Woesearchaeota archaeon]|nr:hypothetical protein [Candidatus Woesearchaeota archaeon]
MRGMLACSAFMEPEILQHEQHLAILLLSYKHVDPDYMTVEHIGYKK